MLDEGHSTTNVDNFSSVPLKDIESGTWELFNSKTRPSLEDKIRSGREQLHLLLRQLDAIFLAGSVFLKRNPTAKIWSLVYVVCLHLWVFYIFMSHTQPTPDARSGTVMSLENMNSSGVWCGERMTLLMIIWRSLCLNILEVHWFIPGFWAVLMQFFFLAINKRNTEKCMYILDLTKYRVIDLAAESFRIPLFQFCSPNS